MGVDDPAATTSLRNPYSRQAFLPALLVGALEALPEGAGAGDPVAFPDLVIVVDIIEVLILLAD